MDYSQVIDTIGSITKEEVLITVNTGSLNNSMVLQNDDPFPGMNDDDLKLKRKSFFIILRYRYAPEKVNRINSKLFQEFQFSRYPSYGEIYEGNHIFPCVRVKEITNTAMIARVQEILKNYDLQLMTYHSLEAKCRIKIFKTFRLAEIGDGLYRDLTDSEKFYIRTKIALNWKSFESITQKIRYSVNNPNFDAAIGVIYRFMGPENVIRIFDKDITYKRAVELRKYYLQEMKDEIHLSAAHPHM